MYRKCGYLPANRASGVNGVNVSIVEILLPTQFIRGGSVGILAY